MKITQISIRNILGIREIEIKPGSETVLEGPNGAGKSSILNAVRAAFGYGHDATLLRKGEKKGEIVLVMDDGTEVSKTITETKSDSKVTLKDAGRVSASKRFIDSLLDRFALNPVDFLTAPAKYRAELLLESMPIELTVEQVNECLPANFHLRSLNGSHALEVIAATTKTIYDERTGINRVAKNAAAAAEEAKKALPAEASQDDLENLLKEQQENLAEFDLKTGNLLRSLRENEESLIQGFKDSVGDAIVGLMQKDKLEAARVEKEISALRNQHRSFVDKTLSNSRELETQLSGKMEEVRAETSRKAAEVNHQAVGERTEYMRVIAETCSKRDEYIRAQSLRDLIAQREQEAAKNEQASELLTGALDRLSALKDSLVAALPIQGIEIRDGEVFVFEPSVNDYIPFDRANDARRVRIAIEIAKLRAKASKVPLIMVDRLQELDPHQFALFEKEMEDARAEGFQFLLARATGDDRLTIRTQG